MCLLKQTKQTKCYYNFLENGKLRQEAAKSDEEEVEGDDDDGAETKNTYKVVEDVGE